MRQKPMVFTERMSANVSLIGHLFSSTSLALSLPNLYTTVSLTTHKGTKDTWKISSTERLSYQSIDCYLKHLSYVKSSMGFDGGFFVQSNNSFPMGIGLSSSSSSYSALTACAVRAIHSIRGERLLTSHDELAMLSAEGKYSSRHSFYSPWSITQDKSATGASFGAYDDLSHVALVVCSSKKRISIDQIIKLVDNNPMSSQYHDNVRKRVLSAQNHIQNKDWKGLFECVWDDFSELHALFHSSKPSFSFQSDATRHVLQQVKRWWDIYNDGPILVMGLGYVIHLLFRPDQQTMKDRMLETLEYFHCIHGTEAKSEVASHA